MSQFLCITLKVNNHPGVITRIAGLFARRAYNLEGITCFPIGETGCSRLKLFVNHNEPLEQITGQLRKLYDVLSLEIEPIEGEIALENEENGFERPSDSPT
jgi:acetolactate synthase-1/3 small subunit